MTCDVDRVVFVEPDPTWPARYTAEAARIEAAVEGRFVRLEHIGSTAVPGLAAKPTIDLLAGITSLDAIAPVTACLEPLGYQWRPLSGGDSDVAYYRRIHDGVRMQHLHVVLAADFDGDERRRFRDILRARPDLVAAYAALKRELAVQHVDDRMGYTNAKTDFVTSVLAGRR